MSSNSLPRIQTSPDGHYLMTAHGQPFFWLGDTAWELYHRLNREEIERYLENRRLKGFNVIQAVALAELDGLRVPNPNGDVPFEESDIDRPIEAYWQNIDWAIQIAADKGLYTALLPTWGDKVTELWGEGPVIFNPDTAYRFGQWIGARYGGLDHVIWVLGGDRPAVHEENDYRPIWRAMAAGITAGSPAAPLFSYHPNGGWSTSAWLQDEEWLHIHMMQSGHGGGHDVPVWEWVERDYVLTPTRPVLDSEINYEDHPVSAWPTWDARNGHFRDHDVRKQSYRSVFAGACGVTYGNHYIWQMVDHDRSPANNGNEFMTWYEALDRPGASQVVHLRRLLESRPYFSRIPDQGLLADNPSGGYEHRQAARDAHGHYAMIYLPIFTTVTVITRSLNAECLAAWWYNPRSGAAHHIGDFENTGSLTFTAPLDGPDWVLVLDDVQQAFGPPGMNSDAARF
jgi:hypothetical protein